MVFTCQAIHTRFEPANATLTVHNRCDDVQIDARFRPLIAEVIAAYLEVFADGILDTRLQGTVVRGDAVVGQSDIDFMALIKLQPSDEARARLENRTGELGWRYPVVSRVELDAASLDSLTPFQHFVLSSDSLSIYGIDRLMCHRQRIDRIELAKLVTPHAVEMIPDYRELMRDVGDDMDAAHFYGRIVAKDLLKCLRGPVLLRGGPYEVSVAGMYRQIAHYATELAGLADALLVLCRGAPGDPASSLAALDEAETKLLPLLDATSP